MFTLANIILPATIAGKGYHCAIVKAEVYLLYIYDN